MGYQSIFAPSAPSQPTTLPGGGYTSIFTPQPHIAAANKAVSSSMANERSQLKRQLNPQLQQQLQQADQAVKRNTAKGFNLKNLGKAAAQTAQDVGQFVARAPIELAATGQELITGKPTTYAAKTSPAGKFIFGDQPVQSTIQQGIQAAQTHPKGFHIKGTPITLSPTETGLLQTVGKTGLNIGAAKGLSKQIVKAATKEVPSPASGEPFEKNLTSVKKPPTIEGKSRGLPSSRVVSGANNQLLIDSRELNTVHQDALNSTLKASGGKGLGKSGTLTPVSIDELKTVATGHPSILQNSEVQRALNVARQKTSRSLTSSPSGQAANINGQLLSAGPTTTSSTKLSGSSGKPKVAQYGEEGYAAPGQAAVDVKAMLQKHQASTKFSGDLEKNATQVEGSKAVIAEDTGKLIKSRQPISNTDKQTLQDYRDAKAAGLTPKPLPEHLVAEDRAVTELNKAAQAHDAELARLNGQEAKAQTIEARDPETYTHREAMDKGTALDYLAQGSRKNPLSVGGYSKTTPASKSRVFHSVTDEQGNRRVVAVKNTVLKDEQGHRIAQGKLVQALDKGGTIRENLGKLKLNTYQDFLDKELQPFKTKINSLQKEYNSLSKVKTKGGVSEARMNALSRKAALLEDARGFSVLSKSERKSLREATLKFQELSKVKEPGTTATGRLQTLNRHLIDLNNKVGEIHDKYDPENLNKKVFVGKDGKRYTVGQATQSEITKASGQKYYVDPKLLALKNYAESRVALENARFIQSIKDHPDFEKFASEPGQTAPKGWQGVKGLDQFRGYKFEPKTAEVMRDLVKNAGGDEKKLLDQAGRVLRQTIVYFPLKHSLNEGVTYAVDRGLSALVNPMAYKRGAQSLVKAFHDVTNQSADFQAAQKAGLHTVTGGDKVLQDAFAKEIKSLSGDERTIADAAKAWGSTPKRVYSAVQNLTVWQLQDILNMARVNERMAPRLLGKGADLEEAVAKTQRFNLQYSVPSRVGPRILPGRVRRGLANTLASPKVFFGRYRYDLFRILSNTIKDTVNLKSLKNDPKANAQALDKLAAMAFGAAIVWPLVDKGIQKVSGNKNAYMKPAGVLELLAAVKNVAQGKKAPLTEASNQIYLSSVITQGIDLKTNRDSFTGKQIYDPNTSLKQQFSDISKWVAAQQAPAQQLKQGTSGKSKVGVDILLSLTSARLPKNSPEVNAMNSLKFDTLPNIQRNAKDMAAKGNVSGAINAIKQYDSQVLQATKTALKSAGQPVPDDKTLAAKLKQQGFYYNPTRATVQSWTSPLAKTGTLEGILNAKPTPKKGDPGYLQYKMEQRQKSFLNRFKNPADKLPVIP